MLDDVRVMLGDIRVMLDGLRGMSALFAVCIRSDTTYMYMYASQCVGVWDHW